MEKLPSISVQTAEELRESEQKMLREGRTVIPYDNPETGCIGFVGFFQIPEGKVPEKEWTATDEDAKFYTWPKFGKELTPEDVWIKNSNELSEAFTQHCNHTHFRSYADSIQQTLGFVCYCKADEGKSLVIRVTISTFKELPQELKDMLYPRKPTVPSPPAT